MLKIMIVHKYWTTAIAVDNNLSISDCYFLLLENFQVLILHFEDFLTGKLKAISPESTVTPKNLKVDVAFR